MRAMGKGTLQPIGIVGTINRYGVLVLGDVVIIEREGEEVAQLSDRQTD